MGLSSKFQITNLTTRSPSEYLVNTQQVYKKLREIKTTKCPGPDMLPNKILRIFACELAPIITDIYNSSMMQGVLYNNYSKTRNLIGQYPCRMRQSCTGNLKVDIASHFTSFLRGLKLPTKNHFSS